MAVEAWLGATHASSLLPKEIKRSNSLTFCANANQPTDTNMYQYPVMLPSNLELLFGP
jgi:hypothetical protein